MKHSSYSIQVTRTENMSHWLTVQKSAICVFSSDLQQNNIGGRHPNRTKQTPKTRSVCHVCFALLLVSEIVAVVDSVCEVWSRVKQPADIDTGSLVCSALAFGDARREEMVWWFIFRHRNCAWSKICLSTRVFWLPLCPATPATPSQSCEWRVRSASPHGWRCTYCQEGVITHRNNNCPLS